MRSTSRLLVAGVAALAAAGCAKAQEEKTAAPPARTQQANSLQGSPDWRLRMHQNHNADSSVDQQVRRLTTDLALSPEQQVKVRQLSREHNDRIQRILDTAPDTLSYAAFQVQVHAISAQYHDAVNAILTPHQLELMKTMVGRLDNRTEARRAP